jgi:hypothetical protein
MMGHTVMAHNSSIATPQKSARPYNRNLRYNRTLPVFQVRRHVAGAPKSAGSLQVSEAV